MKSFTWRGNTDFYTGLLLIGIAAFALTYIRTLEIGTVTAMGSGYFPFGLAVIVGGMGAFLAVKGLVTKGAPVETIHLRPLILICLSFLAFGVLIQPAGLVIAVLAQVAIAHFASRETILRHSIITGIVVAAISAVVFVILLRLPVKMLP